MSTRYALDSSKFLSSREETELVLSLKEKVLRLNRDALLIMLALRTGGRAQEVLSVKRRDLIEADDSGPQRVFLKGLKGSDDREIPLEPALFDALVRYASAMDAGDDLFPITYKRLNQVWHRLRTCRKKFHALRHTFALGAYDRTKDIRLVKTALGHRSLVNTMIYLDYRENAESLRRLIA